MRAREDRSSVEVTIEALHFRDPAGAPGAPVALHGGCGLQVGLSRRSATPGITSTRWRLPGSGGFLLLGKVQGTTQPTGRVLHTEVEEQMMPKQQKEHCA